MDEEIRDIKIIPGVYTGKPPRPVRRIIDLIVGISLIAVPLWAFGAYLYISVPVAAFGLVFLITQRIINRKDEPGDKARTVSMVIRVIGAVVLVLYLAMISGFGSSIRGMYPLKKFLYIKANYKATEEFDFMPDSLPKPADELEMQFRSKSFAKDHDGHIVISFHTDKDGVEEIGKLATEKGGTAVEEESFVYKKLKVCCEELDESIKGSTVWSMGEPGKHCPAYLANSESGLCIIYW